MKNLIDKYIERIKKDYPEDDKLMIDLQNFGKEYHKEQLALTGVVQAKPEVCNHEMKLCYSNIATDVMKCNKCGHTEH